MKKFLNENCGGEKTLFDLRLENRIKNFAAEPPSEDCRACRDVSNESRKLKSLLKSAMEKEFAPQSLIDSIRRGIRR